MAEFPIRSGMFFEEFEVGQRLRTAGRTITEADIVAFAGVSGDYNQIHTNAEFSKTTPFGQRVAHGLLGLSIVSGLVVQAGILQGTVQAFREVNSWKFTKPVFIGDTLQVDVEVVETKALPRLGNGIIVIRLSTINQHAEPVMSGTWTALVAGRQSAS